MCDEISFGSVDEIWKQIHIYGSPKNCQKSKYMSGYSDCSETDHNNVESIKEDNDASSEISMESFKSELSSFSNIIQLDGNVSEEEEEQLSSLFTINTDIDEIRQLVTFFRSFGVLWQALVFHPLCNETLPVKCFLCCTRSSILRLTSKRIKGPKSLKLYEMISQLDQLETLLNWNWSENKENIPLSIKKVISLLLHHDKRLSSLFGIPQALCLICGATEKFEKNLFIELSTDHLEPSKYFSAYSLYTYFLFEDFELTD